MCPTKIEPSIEPISLDLSAAFSFEHGFGRAELLQLGTRLDTARQALLAAITAGAQPCLAWPQRLLAEYKTLRRESLLNSILSAAKQLREQVDRVVAIGPAELIGRAFALFRAGCHPYHNELSRGQRGGRPRMYFVPALPDNDAVQALMETLPRDRKLNSADENWGVLALDWPDSDARHSAFTTALLQSFWDALQTTSTWENEHLRATAAGPIDCPVLTHAVQANIPQVATDEATRKMSSEECENRQGWFHPSLMLAASVMGLDMVKLLRGAAMMHERFATAPPGNNPALDLAGMGWLLSERGGVNGRKIACTWAALNPLAQNLQNASHGEHLLIQWLIDDPRHDRLKVNMPVGKTAEGRVKSVEQCLTDLAAEQATTVRQARTAKGQPTVAIGLPTIDEGTIGQLLQMFSLAAAVQKGEGGMKSDE